MKLVDFLEDEQLNQLRATMQQPALGNFELFDAARHLSWSEREALHKTFLSVSLYQLSAYQGKHLAFKNSRVFYLDAANIGHFALCDDVKKQRDKNTALQVHITLNKSQVGQYKVCPYCLHAVAYQGFDVYRTRHKEYAEGVLKDFSWADFLQNFSEKINP
jgi:hypothetical protein